MQSLAPGTRWVGHWAGYEIVIDATHPHAITAYIRPAPPPLPRDIPYIAPPVATMPLSPETTPTDAIRWAAAWLERHGASALIDGRVENLAELLSFTEE